MTHVDVKNGQRQWLWRHNSISDKKILLWDMPSGWIGNKRILNISEFKTKRRWDSLICLGSGSFIFIWTTEPVPRKASGLWTDLCKPSMWFYWDMLNVKLLNDLKKGVILLSRLGETNLVGSPPPHHSPNQVNQSNAALHVLWAQQCIAMAKSKKCDLTPHCGGIRNACFIKRPVWGTQWYKGDIP